MSPGVRTNTKFRCNGCGRIVDFPHARDIARCPCGTFNWEQLRIVHVCDFCSSTEARWAYPCQDFRAPMMPGDPMQQWSRGGWAACDPCHELIEANDLTGLISRALDAEKPTGKHRRALRRYLEGFYRGFLRNRSGEARLDPEVVAR